MSRLSFLRQRKGGLDDSLTGLFHKRQERFLAALEKVLSVVGSDQYVHQMFDDESSACYIPDRICELVRTVLVDDREALLERLMTRLNALQACFGSERTEKIETLGARFIDASMSEPRQESEIRKCVALLREQLASLEAELAMKYGSETVGTVDVKKKEVREMASEVAEQVKALEKEMQKCFADAKRQVEQYVRASAGGFQIENLRERCEKRVGTLKTKLRTAVAFIKEQANEVDALKAELKKLKSEDGEVTMERLRQELREVKADAEVKAIALERVNAHNQALARENEEKEARMRELRFVVGDLTDKVGSLENSYGERTRAFNDERRKKETLREVVSEHRAEIKVLRQDLRDHDRQFREFQSSLDDPTDEKDQKIVDLSEENVQLQRKVKYYESTIENMKRRQSELEEGAQRQDDKIGDMMAELEQCKSNLAKQKRLFDAQVAEKDDEIWKLNKQKTKAESDLDDMEAQLQKIQRVTQAQLQDKDEEITRMQSEIDEYKNASQEAYEDFTAQKTSLTNENMEKIAKLEKKIQKLQQVTDEQNQTIEALDQENAELREASQSIIKEDGEREAQLIADNDSLTRENMKLHAKIERLNEELANTRNLLQRSKFGSEMKTSRFMADNEELVETLKKSVSKENQQMKQKIAGLEETVRVLKDKSLLDSEKKLNKKLANMSALNEQLSQKIQDDQDRIEELEAEVSDRGYRIRKLERELARIRNLNKSDGNKSDLEMLSDSQGSLWSSTRTGQNADRILSIAEDVDEQTNSVKDLLRQNKRLSRELDRTKMELKNHQETSSVTEKIEQKKLQRVQEIANELTRMCRVQSFEEVIDAVEEMQLTISRENETIAKLKQITDKADPISAAWKHKKDSEDLRKLQEALMPNMPLVPVDSLIADLAEESQGKEEMSSREKAVLHILGIESPQNIIKALTNLRAKCDFQQQLLTELCNTFKVDSADEIQRTTEQVVREKRELEKKLITLLDVETPQAALTELSALKRQFTRIQEINAKLCKMLDLKDEKEIPDLVSQLIRENDDLTDREEQIMVTLSIDKPDDILKSLDEQQLELSRYTKVLETLITTLGCSNDIEVVEAVNHLLEETQRQERESNAITRSLGVESSLQTPQQIRYLCECSDITQELCHMLNVGHPDGLTSAVSSLISANQRFQSLHKLFTPDLTNTSLRDKISQLIDRNDELRAERQQLANILKSDNLAQSITQIVRDMESSSRLLSRILGIFSTSPVKLTLPMSETNEQHLVEVIADFKAKADKSQTQLDAIISRARVDGYRGTIAMDAVDFIAAHCADIERQKAHKDIMSVRASSDMERTLAERQRERSRKRIDSLRSTLAETTSREEELISSLEQERQKVKQLEQERKPNLPPKNQ